MTRPLVTIAIPFHAEERSLGRAIASVLAQRFGDFELLLVDDGSRDRSLEIARSVRDPRVIVVSDGRRRGLPARLNEIVRLARGELVARMDADDVCHEERLERQVAVLDSDPACDAVGTWIGLSDDDDVVLGVSESATLPASRATALERGILAHATMVARRAWLNRHCYDERYTRAEDRELWCRTVATTRFAVVEQPLYVARVATRSSDFLPKYLESQRQNRRLFHALGPQIVGRRRTLELVALTHAKSLVLRTAVAAGLAQRIVRRRGRPPTPAERAMIEHALRGGAAQRA